MAERDEPAEVCSHEELRKALESLEPSSAARHFADMYGSELSGAGKQLSEPSDDDNDEEAVEALNYLKQRHKAEIDRLEADNGQRKWFFRFVLFVTALPVIVASVAMTKYVWTGGNSEAIYIGYFTSVVVEVIGLSIVIANYLFPRNGSLQTETEEGND